MAKVAGLFGKPSGKLAQLVFATWKGIGYARLYVIPANPSTINQVIVRTRFTICVRLAKAVLGSVLRVFWDPFISGNSGFSEFIGRCMKDIGTPPDFQAVQMASGVLEGSTISSASLAASTVTVAWSTAILGNGAAADKACVVVYDAQYGVAFFNASAQRSAGTVGVNVGSGRTAADLHAYLFFADSSTAPTTVSNSVAEQVV